MKRSNQKIAIFCATAALAACVGLSACGTQASGISNVYVNDSGEIVVAYGDGTTTTLGQVSAGDSTKTTLTVKDAYDEYVKQYGEIGYAEFLSLYFNSSTESEERASVQNCLFSSASVYTFFTIKQTNQYGWGGWTSTTYTTGTQGGSAVIYRMDDDYTYFLTNYHVTYNTSSTTGTPERIVLYLYGSESSPVAESRNSNGTTNYSVGAMALEGTYVGGSATADLALVRVKTSDVISINNEAKPVTLANDYQVGQTCYAIGNTEAEGISVTKGIISKDNEYINLSVDGTTRSYRSIRMDAAIYEGNSGGGLFNSAGQLIGLNNAGSSTDQNVNNAIPVEIVRGVTDNLLYQAKKTGSIPVSVKKPTIGIEVVGSDSKFVMDGETGFVGTIATTTVAAVHSGSIVDKLGLKTDDVVKEMIVNGVATTIHRQFTLSDLLYTVREGDTLAFTVVRDGSSLTTTTYTFVASDFNTVE